MKIGKAGILTKLVVLALLVVMATALLEMGSRLSVARADLEAAKIQLASQKQVNADLLDAVEHSEDPERQADVARAKLGLVKPDERVFKFN